MVGPFRRYSLHLFCIGEWNSNNMNHWWCYTSSPKIFILDGARWQFSISGQWLVGRYGLKIQMTDNNFLSHESHWDLDVTSSPSVNAYRSPCPCAVDPGGYVACLFHHTLASDVQFRRIIKNKHAERIMNFLGFDSITQKINLIRCSVSRRLNIC